MGRAIGFGARLVRLPTFFDYASVDAGRIPDYILEDEKLVEKLPAFFRTLSGQKPDREDLEKLLEIIRSSHQP